METTYLFAYRTSSKKENIFECFLECSDPDLNIFDIIILRSQNNGDEGTHICFQPLLEAKDEQLNDLLDWIKSDFVLLPFSEATPLSDFYFTLIQEAYYLIGNRKHDIGEIGEQFNYYINWST
jgi:hypothetical protein